MWPKMLLELLPHLGRLVPMAEKFLATRGQRDQEEQAALASLGETLRLELGKVSASHAELERAFADQGQQVTAVAAEVVRARTAVEAMDTRLSRLESGLAAAEKASERAEQAAARLSALFIAIVVLLLVVAGLMVFVVIRLGGR